MGMLEIACREFAVPHEQDVAFDLLDFIAVVQGFVHLRFSQVDLPPLGPEVIQNRLSVVHLGAVDKLGEPPHFLPRGVGRVPDPLRVEERRRPVDVDVLGLHAELSVPDVALSEHEHRAGFQVVPDGVSGEVRDGGVDPRGGPGGPERVSPGRGGVARRRGIATPRSERITGLRGLGKRRHGEGQQDARGKEEDMWRDPAHRCFFFHQELSLALMFFSSPLSVGA